MISGKWDADRIASHLVAEWWRRSNTGIRVRVGGENRLGSISNRINDFTVVKKKLQMSGPVPVTSNSLHVRVAETASGDLAWRVWPLDEPT